MATRIVPAPPAAPQGAPRRMRPLLLLAVLVLAACAASTRVSQPDLEQQIGLAVDSAAAGRPTEAAERFEALAAAHPERAAELHARAADAWLAAGDRVRATAALDRARALPADAAARGSIAVVEAELARLA